MLRGALLTSLCVSAALWLGCGGRTPVSLPAVVDGGTLTLTETCNALDDDGDGQADEGFRDEIGRYVQQRHCGSCNHACDQPLDNAQGDATCQLIGESPTCAASACRSGFALTPGGRCEAEDTHMCLPCLEDEDCGPLASARCLDIDGERRCTRGCEDGCPSGYQCEGDRCLPQAGSCRCIEGSLRSSDFVLACELADGCVGTARCRDDQLGVCMAREESCGGGDDDCDGTLDEGFLDAHSVYSAPEHCGACGKDCTEGNEASVPLTCGGDPFNPRCVIRCSDLLDGRVDIGDDIDADGDIDNGCECQVRSLRDTTGGATDALDDNCDGADGSVLDSFYVAKSGNDTNPGSPTLPLATIEEAVRRAHDTLGSAEERRDVYVSSGVYAETVHLLEGVRVHGGYRGDFLARDPNGFEVIVVAPAFDNPVDPPGGAALIAVDVGFQDTMFEGIELRGRDALGPGDAAIGVSLIRTGPNLVLRDLSIRAGRPGSGLIGADGNAGSGPTSESQAGSVPRAAIEGSGHFCIEGASNVGVGGRGGRNMCNGVSVRGGDGGQSVCPVEEQRAADGERGSGRADALGGLGGLGGITLTGPIEDTTSCPGICCGLADFNVPVSMFAPLPGEKGADGVSGTAGDACTDSAGSVDELGHWQPTRAFGGRRGEAGGGGGGGGAGGGVLMSWTEDVCEFADGLGGAGGGGGAGGCGGDGGQPGMSGGPSIAILLRLAQRNHMPQISSCVLRTERGGRGGDGGNGGDGGPGGHGAFGGRLPEEQRVTPSLAGPSSGERGGKGGDGGPGGGGGGGCGGSSIGLWISGDTTLPIDVTTLQASNDFELALGGEPGVGGGGALSADDGAEGQSIEVLVR